MNHVVSVERSEAGERSFDGFPRPGALKRTGATESVELAACKNESSEARLGNDLDPPFGSAAPQVESGAGRVWDLP